MIPEARINEIAQKAAFRYLKRDSVERVTSRDSTDFEGNQAVRITIRLHPGVAQRLEGDDVVDTLVAIKSELAKAGEERPSLIEYEEAGEATEGDDADPEP